MPATSEPGSLCNICADFPFSSLFPPFGHPNEGSWLPPETLIQLGTLGEISARDCPLCRLVTTCVIEVNRSREVMQAYTIQSDFIIGLLWQDDAAPHGGFRLQLEDRNRFPHLVDRPVGTIIGFANGPRGLASPSFLLPFGRLQTQMDFSRLRYWISGCDDHGSKCQTVSDRSRVHAGLTFLRLIDVDLHCLVEIQEPGTYVTLSYVWGNTPQVRLTRANKAFLSTPGALRATRLSRTVADAVTLTQKLGYKYLWVDALCLVQNDPEDVALGTAVMDLIFELSNLTIIAASGKDAESGLPGVGEASRLAQQPMETIKPGVCMAVYTDLDSVLQPTTYRSRAWTFQEQLLSARALFFVNNQVFYRCREVEYAEARADRTLQDVSLSGESKAMKMNAPVRDLAVLLSSYSHRALTYQTDVYKAISGIIRRFSDEMECEFIEGLPIAELDFFLLFVSSGSVSLRRREGFPSYSWTGWIGGIEFLERHSIDIGGSCWISWYQRHPNGSTELIVDRSTDTDVSSTQRSTDPFSDVLPLITGRDTDLSISSAWDPPTEPTEVQESVPNYTLLQFWTWSVFYTIEPENALSTIAHLKDRHGNCCGCISMDGYEETTYFESRAPLEFIILSKSARQTPDLGSNFAYLSGRDRPLYNVMCLEREDLMAQRRGVGGILYYARAGSFEPGPRWNEVVLA